MVAHVDPLGLAFLEQRAETFTACDTTDDYVSLDLRRRAIAIAARYTPVVETVRVTWPSTIDTLGPLGRSRPAWRGGRVVCGADAGVRIKVVPEPLGKKITPAHHFPSSTSMHMREFEFEIQGMVASVRGLGVPDRDLDEVLQMAHAYEPGIAIANLCTLLFESNVELPQFLRSIVASLVHAIGLDSRYVDRLP